MAKDFEMISKFMQRVSEELSENPEFIPVLMDSLRLKYRLTDKPGGLWVECPVCHREDGYCIRWDAYGEPLRLWVGWSNCLCLKKLSHYRPNIVGFVRASMPRSNEYDERVILWGVFKFRRVPTTVNADHFKVYRDVYMRLCGEIKSKHKSEDLVSPNIEEVGRLTVGEVRDACERLRDGVPTMTTAMNHIVLHAIAIPYKDWRAYVMDITGGVHEWELR